MAHAKKHTFFLLATVIMIGCGESTRENSQTHFPSLSIHTEVLDRPDLVEADIIDGDTIKLTFDGKLTTVRLIGIDTFESRKNNKAYRQAYEHNITVEEVVLRGKSAKTYITKRLSKRVNLYLEYDEEFLDRYDRTLGYVWFSDDDMLNLDIICEGYALPLTIKTNDKYAKAFQECYTQAQALGLGVWK
jgi:micrococcal nuclease